MSADFDKALQIGRPPNIQRLFPNPGPDRQRQGGSTAMLKRAAP